MPTIFVSQQPPSGGPRKVELEQGIYVVTAFSLNMLENLLSLDRSGTPSSVTITVERSDVNDLRTALTKAKEIYSGHAGATDFFRELLKEAAAKGTPAETIEKQLKKICTECVSLQLQKNVTLYVATVPRQQVSGANVSAEQMKETGKGVQN